MRDRIEKGNIILKLVFAYYQLADIFTKSLSEDRFNFIRKELGMLNLDARIEGEPSLIN